MKNAKTGKKCQKASGVKHSDEMAAASLKARCKCTMMRKLFAAFDEERGLKTAKCMSNCQRGGKANKMSRPSHSSSQEEGTFLFHAHPICEFSGWKFLFCWQQRRGCCQGWWRQEPWCQMLEVWLLAGASVAGGPSQDDRGNQEAVWGLLATTVMHHGNSSLVHSNMQCCCFCTPHQHLADLWGGGSQQG